MLKNSLKMLDIDEHLRKIFERIHSSALKICKQENCILDCATSDVVMYVQNCPNKSSMEKIAACYPNSNYDKDLCDRNEWVLY
jgi:ketopantoate reductase